MKTIKKVIRFLYDIVQYFIRKFDEHAVGAFSAQASFFTIISFFPFVMLLMALLKQLPFSTDELFVFSQTFFPKSFSDFFQATVTEIPTLSSAPSFPSPPSPRCGRPRAGCTPSSAV